MGSKVRLTFYAADAQQAREAATAAFARVAKLEKICSDYMPDSELTQLNRSTLHHASADLLEVVRRSLEFSKITSGAFDITTGHFTNLWRRSRRKLTLPTAEQLETARAVTGYDLVKLDVGASTITFAKPGMQLDLGGIAKGYAADAALGVLKQRGFGAAVVAVSGDLAVGDAPPDQPEGWPIKLRTFEAPEATDQLVTIRLKNCGVSTSGDLHQFAEIAGTRYSHIIDPASGLGLTRSIACSVIAADATSSDALATAACILGPDKALHLPAELRIVVCDGSEITTKTSAHWPSADH